MYIKLNHGVAEPYSLSALKSDNPNVSFPKTITDDIASSFGVYPAVVDDQPDFDQNTQNCFLANSATQVDGAWVYSWVVTNKTLEEISAHNDAIAKQVRYERDRLLAESDWMVIKSAETGVVLATEWATYRQALRDITTHANFPYLQDSDWPEAP
jgi:hypothetical protein